MKLNLKSLIFYCFCILFSFSVSAQNIDGVYSTDFNEMSLQQSGNRVTGTYKHAGGTIDGTLSGNTLTGWWYQNNAKGRFVFVFNYNFSSFAGKWSYNEAEPSSEWNGTKISGSTSSGNYSAPSVAGNYKTDFNEMTLQQSGNHVTGTYKHANGRIDGTLNGNTLTGWWYQDNGKGRIVFVFNSDFTAYTGKWSYDDAEPSSVWNGTKTNAGSGVNTNSPVASNPVANTPLVTGVYNTDFNEMTLQQSGSHVTGTYMYSNGRIDGTINGNTLTGWWYQDNGKGRLIFVFNSNFSAFTGKWSYNGDEPSGKWDGSRK